MEEPERSTRRFQVSGVTVGGDTPVLVGSILYSGDKYVENPVEGAVKWKIVLREIERMLNLSRECGVPTMIDLNAETIGAMERYASKICENTSHIPVLVGGISKEIRDKGFITFREYGEEYRAIYNSFLAGRDDLEHINRLEVEYLVVMTYGALPKESVSKLEPDLIDRLFDAGVKGIMVDTGVMDIRNIRCAVDAALEIRERWNVPVGCCPYNGYSSVKWFRKLKAEERTSASLGLEAYVVMRGLDFLLFGPLYRYHHVLPFVSTIVALRSKGTSDRKHPYWIVR